VKNIPGGAESGKVESVECLVVGADVIGLFLAERSFGAGASRSFVESGRGIGGGVSSRSSKVIHGGICYPTGLDKHGSASTVEVDGHTSRSTIRIGRNQLKKCFILTNSTGFG
jgi:L-2-hydroxyglutarate oxidase LhgO